MTQLQTEIERFAADMSETVREIVQTALTVRVNRKKYAHTVSPEDIARESARISSELPAGLPLHVLTDEIICKIRNLENDGWQNRIMEPCS